mmetsp:Transcript_30554/g.80005  ORF Transcript_30554/g.80005 Transcript_30554/m.80005 type:complete len:338 (+) Transcript_30554:361-1374(+)
MAAGEAAEVRALFRLPKTDWLYTDEQLSKPPSLKVAKSSRSDQGQKPPSLDTEDRWRREAVGHIQMLGLYLKVPVTVTAHAASLLHRFYMEQSFLEFRKFYVSTCCILIAMKLSPDWKVSHMARAKDVLRSSLKRVQMTVKDDSAHFHNHLDELLYCERALLATLGFNLDAEVPQALIPRYVNTMGFNKAEKGHVLIKAAVKITNSALGSTLCLQYPPPIHACAALLYAANELNIKFPEPKSGVPWYEAVTVSLSDKTNMVELMDAIILKMKDYVKREQVHLDAQQISVQAQVTAVRAGKAASLAKRPQSQTKRPSSEPSSERPQSSRKRRRESSRK